METIVVANILGVTLAIVIGHRMETISFNITPEEKAACSADAERFCWDTYPDEQRLVVCMEQNRSRLGPTCLKVFDAGLRKRGLD